jgi:hypothetical protein
MTPFIIFTDSLLSIETARYGCADPALEYFSHTLDKPIRCSGKNFFTAHGCLESNVEWERIEIGDDSNGINRQLE